MGIFYSLEVEKDLEGDKGLDDSLKVWELTKAADMYYIAAGKVYRRGLTADHWDEIAPPAEGMLSSDIEYFGGGVLAIFRSMDGNTSKLYVLNRSNLNWIQIPTVSGNVNERIANMIVVGGYLYVSVLNDSAATAYKPYTLFCSGNGSSFTRVDLPGDDNISTRLIFDGDFDGTNYWLVSGNSIITGTDPVVLDTTVTAYNQIREVITPAHIGGIYYCPELDKIFISTQDGTVLAKNQPGLAGSDLTYYWYTSSTAYKGDSVEVFYDIMKVPVSGYDQEGTVVIIVGSDSGYYEIGVDKAHNATSLSLSRPITNTQTTTINYLNTSLSESSLRYFAYDPGGTGGGDDIIFACTTNSGLWRNTYSTDAGQRIWSRE